MGMLGQRKTTRTTPLSQTPPTHPIPKSSWRRCRGGGRARRGPGCPQPARYLRDRRCSVPTCPAGLRVPPGARLFPARSSSSGAAPGGGRIGPRRRGWRRGPAAAVGPGSSLEAAAAPLQRRLEAGTGAEEGGSGAGVHGGGPGGSRCLGGRRAPAAISNPPGTGTGGAARAGRPGGAGGVGGLRGWMPGAGGDGSGGRTGRVSSRLAATSGLAASPGEGGAEAGSLPPPKPARLPLHPGPAPALWRAGGKTPPSSFLLLPEVGKLTAKWHRPPRLPGLCPPHSPGKSWRGAKGCSWTHRPSPCPPISKHLPALCSLNCWGQASSPPLVPPSWCKAVPRSP